MEDTIVGWNGIKKALKDPNVSIIVYKFTT